MLPLLGLLVMTGMPREWQNVPGWLMVSFDYEKQLEEVSQASATLDQKLEAVRKEIGLMEQAKTEAQEFIRELREMNKRKDKIE